MVSIPIVLFQFAGSLSAMDDRIRPDQDMVHYQIAIEIPDSGRSVSAAVSIRYVVRSGPGPLVLDFDSVFVVDSVVAGGRVLPNSGARGWRGVWGDPGWTLRVPHWGEAGDTLEIAVYYRGRPRDGLFLQQNVHGARTAFADNWPDRAHHWFPCEDHPSDKATASFAVRVPAGWRAVANGEARGTDSVEGGRTTWRWATTRRVSTYNMVIGAGRMAVTELGTVGTAPQTVWTFPEDSAYAIDGPFRRARHMAEAYSRLLGPFPYEKLAHVQSSTRFGGMENASAIFYGERPYVERSLSEETVAHEIAHQWFGDAVTERDWHHLWLSEGFASYLGPMYFELVGEPEKFHEAMERNRRVYLTSDVVNRPIIDTTERRLVNLLNANNYPKGAWVLHMLRGVMGDSAFVGGLRAYYAAYRDSTALSSDFAHIMERYAGLSLETFFRQWLAQPGYPQLDVEWRYAGGTITLQVTQTQPPAWGLFELDLPVRIELTDGKRVELQMAIAGRDEVTEHPLASEPRALVVDPRGTLLLEATVTEKR
jgi:aminopeptidase N